MTLRLLKPVTKKSQRTLGQLVAGARCWGLEEVRQRRAVHGGPRRCAAAHGRRCPYSVAQYFKSNGDLCPDPDVVCLRRADGRFCPISFQTAWSATSPCLARGWHGRGRRSRAGEHRGVREHAPSEHLRAAGDRGTTSPILLDRIAGSGGALKEVAAPVAHPRRLDVHTSGIGVVVLWTDAADARLPRHKADELKDFM